MPVVSVYTTFDGVALRDGVDITPEGVVEKLRAGQMPTLSQPSPGDFYQVYRGIAERAPGGKAPPIVSIHVTAKLSGTQNSAALARRMCPDLDITIVDSGTGSMGAGFMVLKAARAAQAGMDRDQVVAIARRAAAQACFYLLVPDLAFIHHAGRLGKAAVWLGQSLSLAPVLSVSDGVVVPYRLSRSKDRALHALATAAARRYRRDQPMWAAAVHVDAENDARLVLDEVAGLFQLEEKHLRHAGAAVSAVLGPGTVGLCMLPA